MNEVTLTWLEESIYNRRAGVSFGVPWAKGTVKPDQKFGIRSEHQELPLDSWNLAYWPDGSVKWTGHAVGTQLAQSPSYQVVLHSPVESSSLVSVNTGTRGEAIIENDVGLRVKLAAKGSNEIINSISLHGHLSSSQGRLIASTSDNSDYSSQVQEIEVEKHTHSRVVVKVTGTMSSANSIILPFHLRIYVYAGSKNIRVVHSFVYDLEQKNKLLSLGLSFKVPFHNANFYNRHVRIVGSDIGILREEVQGLSGSRAGPPESDRRKQVEGKSLDEREWDPVLQSRLQYIPTWDEYFLTQLSSDGFEIKKRTKKGCSAVKVIGGTRASGVAYIGGPATGGLALGMSDFWERYPTEMALRDLTKDEGEIIAWIYSPRAEPLEMMPYHDGLGKDTYEKQIEGLNANYEDWEPGFDTPVGIARTNQFFIEPFGGPETPSNEELAGFVETVRSLPRMIPDLAYTHSTGVFGGYWSPNHTLLGYEPSNAEAKIEHHLDTLFNYYKGQIEQNRWYGFWDYGDVQHTYDKYRHAWRYDVGGFAWDNSELSTDLWLWLYFLHTRRPDVFRVAEAMTRHTGEVDVYHAGRFKGFGTRHGVQHFSDSAKQVRISNVFFRRIYFFLTADERVGDLMDELVDCQKAVFSLDSHRKVQDCDPSTIPKGFAMTNIGLDVGALAASWMTTWERRSRDWELSKNLLVHVLEGIGSLKWGLATNSILLNCDNGDILECKPPTPEYAISHLSMLFGFAEIFSEVLEAVAEVNPNVAQKFQQAYLKYCRAYNGGAEVQTAEYGFLFPGQGGMWHQSHSSLQAYAANVEENTGLAKSAWHNFFASDGYNETTSWEIQAVTIPNHFANGEEATWLSTNGVARYGVTAIHNLARIRQFL
jgi:YetA-like protein